MTTDFLVNMLLFFVTVTCFVLAGLLTLHAALELYDYLTE